MVDVIREYVRLILEAKRVKDMPEHLSHVGIDLLVNEFVKHARREIVKGDQSKERQLETAKDALRKTLESVYRDMFGRLHNGEFR